jgi:glutamate N-acetyltransferase/amino-acid N-acetyltransferase
VDIKFSSAPGEIEVVQAGRGLDFDEELAKRVLTRERSGHRRVPARGRGIRHLLGCDLTYDYVKINGDYRT